MPPTATAELAPSQVPAATTGLARLRLGKKLGFGLVLAVLALVGTGLYVRSLGFESTDDAQIDADVVAVPARVGGTVARVYFQENQAVKAGEVLAELDAAPLRAALAEADAQLLSATAAAEAADAEARLAARNAVEGRAVAAANVQTSSAGAKVSAETIREGEAGVQAAEAQLKQAELDVARAHQLHDVGAYTRVQRDQADTAFQVAQSNLAAQRARLATLHNSLDQSKGRMAEAVANLRKSSDVEALVQQSEARAKSAHANVELARAARALAALNLSYTQILAPHAGVVSKKAINEGQNVSTGQTVVQLVPDERWVTANFKETQLNHMRPGQPARFTVDAFPDVELEGDVQSFSGATGSRFTLLPPDNATGNFTKVVQRVPVRIRVHQLPAGVVLRPGMSVELTVDTRGKG